MLFIIDLAGVVDSDFQGIQINFALPRPAGFANFRRAGRGSPFSAGRGAHPWFVDRKIILAGGKINLGGAKII